MPDGRLRVDGNLTKTGVFTYINPDGSSRREYRSPEEVFKQDSLESFAGTIVTDDHPPEIITARNARTYSVGHVGEQIRKDGEHVIATLWVNDAETIRKMENGKAQLSCGYECDLVNQAGIAPNGERYDAIQTNIRGNHVAIVDVGRAGPSARVRMDAAVMQPSAHRASHGAPMDSTEALAGALSQVTAQTLRADNAERERDEQRQRADKAEGEANGLRTTVEQLKQRNDSLQAADPDGLRRQIAVLTEQLKQAQKARTDAESPARLREAVKARVALEGAAVMVLGDKFNIDGLTDRAVRVAVVEKLHGVTLGADKSDDYIKARFDTAIEGYAAGSQALARVQEVVNAQREDAAPKLSARDEMIKRNQNAWKPAQKGA